MENDLNTSVVSNAYAVVTIVTLLLGLSSMSYCLSTMSLTMTSWNLSSPFGWCLIFLVFGKEECRMEGYLEGLVGLYYMHVSFAALFFLLFLFVNTKHS